MIEYKLEFRSTKFETILNIKIQMVKTLLNVEFRIWNLFRISNLEFRIFDLGFASLDLQLCQKSYQEVYANLSGARRRASGVRFCIEKSRKD